MSLNNITFSTTVTISPIPPWFFSQPEVDLQIHECIQKGQIDSNIKSYSTEYIRTVYYAFLPIYTDGSRNPEIGRTGSAFYVPEFKMGKYGRLTDGTSVYTAKMVAIQMALSWVEEVMPNKVVICSDSMASLISLQTFQTVRNDIFIEILNILYRLRHVGIIVNFVWVPAHVDIPGNEKSDKMAKESLNLNNPSISVSLSRMEGKSIIKEACNWKWQGNWNDCKTGRQFYNIQNRVSQSKMILNLSREDQVILTRLRMGHTKLNSTLHIIGKHSTGLCEICQVKETVDHVLLHCPRYEQERNELQR